MYNLNMKPYNLNSNIKHITILILLLFICHTSWAYEKEPVNINTIHIATPAWEGQTNEDGTGLFFDIIRTVYEPAGIKMRFEIVPWKRAVQMILSNNADALLDIYRENIDENMSAPQYPLLTEFTVAIFKKNRIKNWTGVKSLEGISLIWLRDYDYHNTRHLKNIKLKWSEVDDYESAWRILEKDRADAYLEAYTDAKHYITSNKIDMNIYQMEKIGGDKGFMACPKTEKSKILINIYDKRIIELLKSGELKKIFEKWNYPFETNTWEK